MLKAAGLNQILILSDGVPGHVNQARGLASWLCAAYGLELSSAVAEVVIRLRHKPMRVLYRTCLNRRFSFAPRLALSGYQNLPAQISSDTLIVSCGGNTSFANVALAQVSGQPNLFIGSLRGLRPDLFTGVLTLESVGKANIKVANNVIMDFSPSYIDIAEIQQAGAEFLHQQQPAQALWCLLIGGNGAGYEFDDADWRVLARAMQRLAEHYNIRWLVTTSRRSGEAVEGILQTEAAQAMLDGIWFSGQGNQSLQRYLGAAVRIFCTEDSMTMLSESINAGKPVVSLRPRKARPNQRFLQALQRFEANGYLQRVAFSELETIALADQSEQHSPEHSKSRVVAEVTSLLEGPKLGKPKKVE